MRIYLVAGSAPIKNLKKAVPSPKRVLVTYLDYDNTYELIKDSDVVIDSAMFWRKKKPMTKKDLFFFMDEYIRFINKVKDRKHIQWFAEMDYYGYFPTPTVDQVRKELEGQTGAYILPVYHLFQPIERLYQFTESYPYIGVGDCIKGNALLDLAKAGIKVHLFGLTSLGILSLVPVYSADSSSWWRYLIFRAGVPGVIPVKFPRGVDGSPFVIDTFSYYRLVEQYVTKYWEERGINYGG